jgi:hypothetical protein
MPLFENCSQYSAVESIGTDARGLDYYVIAAKASYTWDDQGRVCETEAAQEAVVADVCTGKPGESSAALESDLAPEKKQVDVLLAGGIQLAAPATQVDITLQVGRRISKTARVFGDRHWVEAFPLVLTKPTPFVEMPIEWERSFGGTDPDNPSHREVRNPFGAGMRKEAKSLEKARAANFETPGKLIDSWRDRPPPIGFGPIDRMHPERAKYVGTYDEKWQEERAPLLPTDFDPRYYNCAPLDQRLDGYQVGEEVLLKNMTPKGSELFLLPEFAIEVVRIPKRTLFVEPHKLTPDTIIIEPAARRFSLVGRFCCYPPSDVHNLGRIFVSPTKARLRALQRRKLYVDWRANQVRE